MASACRSDGRSSIPEKIEALYVLIFIHIKMAVEKLVQQLEAAFVTVHWTLHVFYVEYQLYRLPSRRILSFKVIVH